MQFLKNRQNPNGVILQLKDHIQGLHLDYRIKGMFSHSGLKLFLEWVRYKSVKMPQPSQHPSQQGSTPPPPPPALSLVRMFLWHAALTGHSWDELPPPLLQTILQVHRLCALWVLSPIWLVWPAQTLLRHESPGVLLYLLASQAPLWGNLIQEATDVCLFFTRTSEDFSDSEDIGWG